MRKFIFILVLLLLVSCGVETPTYTVIPTSTITPTSTSIPTSVPTLRPIPIKTPPVKGLVPDSIKGLEEVEVANLVYFPIIYNYPQVLIKSLGNEFLKHNIKFGFSVGSGIRNSKIQNEIVEYHAEVVTMENEYKMKQTQPTKGNFTFWGSDQIILFGSENNIDVYGHGISWAIFNPTWINKVPDSELAYELDRHVRTVCSHNQTLSGIDVANEAYAGGSRDSVLNDNDIHAGTWLPLGVDYINISFNSCKDVTNIKVFYNSFFPHSGDSEKAIQLLDSGLAGGVGIQFHLTEGVDYQGLFNRARYIIQESRKRGTPVRFSEVGVWATSEEKQALIYRDVVRLALDNSDVVTDFIIWGVTDPSWRGNVTLFNSDGSPKQSAYAILDELEDN